LDGSGHPPRPAGQRPQECVGGGHCRELLGPRAVLHARNPPL